MFNSLFKISCILFVCLVLSNQLMASQSDRSIKQEDEQSVNLASVSAAVVELNSGKTLLEKNTDIVMPIASITKVMTAMVVLDAKLPLDEKIRFSKKDKQRINNYFSRIRVDSELKRKDVIRIALMSSENMAAAALGRAYPGGMPAFVKAMNKKARSLGMTRTRFVDSSGLSENNTSTAADLAKMVAAAARYPLIREYSTTSVYTARFKRPRYVVGYTNTNVLVRRKDHDVKLSKTGYLDEAGRCLVMLRNINGKDTVMVMLDSFGKRSPVGDANRIKKWLQTGKRGKVARAAKNYEQMKLAYYHTSQ